MEGNRNQVISKGAKWLLLVFSALGFMCVSFLAPSSLSFHLHPYLYEKKISNPRDYSRSPGSDNQPSPERRLRVSTPQTTAAGFPVLMYHRIDNTPDPYNLYVTVKNFEAQMHYLFVKGYHTVSLPQLQDYLMLHRPLPSKPIVITFDDGNKDNVTTALPILHHFGFTAAIFIAGRYVGKSGAVTLADIQTLAAGGWDIGNHTFSHAHMAHLNTTQQNQELDEDNALLQKALPGQAFHFFAYPTGDYSDSVVTTLKADGFTLAFTTDHGWLKPSDNPYELPRLYVGPSTSLAQFAAMTGRPFYPGGRINPHLS